MSTAKVDELISEFSGEKHGNSDYYKDQVYVLGEDGKSMAPLSYILKKMNLANADGLHALGFVHDSFEIFSPENFEVWYEEQFSRKLKTSGLRNIAILHRPNNKTIFDAIETVNKMYEILRRENILLNGKKLPVQLGEWYAKNVFGLRQVKSASQRGFDFYLGDKTAEVMVHWGDQASPKGIKLRKSLVQLSEYCIIVYVARNLMIREICFLDSSFVLRKFASKGHTIFLKDTDISSYFFSHSNKHVDKVKNKIALMKYSMPTLAMKLSEHFS